jgi:hypothetical protein
VRHHHHQSLMFPAWSDTLQGLLQSSLSCHKDRSCTFLLITKTLPFLSVFP